MSRLFTRPSVTGWKLAILRGLDNKKVVAVFKAAVLGVSTLP